MERRFDMTDFEQSLRDHADHFVMVPSKRVWHGIYNNLHPGSKWPSITVAIVFLFALIGIGHFNNNSSKQLSVSNDSASEKNSNDKNFLTQTNNYSLTSTIKSRTGSNLTFWKNEELINRLQTEGKLVKSDFVEKPVFSANKEAGSDENSQAIASLSTQKESARIVAMQQKAEEVRKSSGSAPSLAIATITEKSVEPADLLQEARGLNTVSSNNEAFESYQENIKFLAVKYPAIMDENMLLADNNSQDEFLKSQVSPSEVRLKKNADGSEIVSADASASQAAKNNISKDRKKGKATWVYFFTPTISSVSFGGEAIAPIPGRGLSFLNQSNQFHRDMIYNVRLGYSAGIQVAHPLSEKWQLITGATLTHSGYKVISNQVHPTFAYLMLKDGSTGNTYSKSYITHYGNGQGQNQISLSNNSLQASIPVGLEYKLWGNEKVKITVASTIAPSAILKSNSFIMSADGRNYVSDPDLLRKFNLNGDLGSFITFSAKKIKWHIGPSIRYQLLSTYTREYPVKEHLIDYGLKLGISK